MTTCTAQALRYFRAFWFHDSSSESDRHNAPDFFTNQNTPNSYLKACESTAKAMPVCCFPFAAIGLTALYGAFCYAVLNYGPSCPEGCRSEGVNNAPIAWASDVFCACVLLLLSCHLLCTKRDTCKAFMAMATWGIAHILWAVVGAMYANDGTGDGKGQWAYFILTMTGYGFATDSILEASSLSVSVWNSLAKEYQSEFCGAINIRAFQMLAILAFLSVATGSIWCASTEDILTGDVLDSYPNDIGLKVPICVEIVSFGKAAWTTATTLFWIAVACVYGGDAKQTLNETDSLVYVWGLPSALAAAGVVCFQILVLVFHILAFAVSQNSEKQPEDDAAAAATITYHYCIIMTGLLIHNMLYSAHARKSFETNSVEDRDLELGNGSSVSDRNTVHMENQPGRLYNSQDKDEIETLSQSSHNSSVGSEDKKFWALGDKLRENRQVDRIYDEEARDATSDKGLEHGQRIKAVDDFDAKLSNHKKMRNSSQVERSGEQALTSSLDTPKNELHNSDESTPELRTETVDIPKGPPQSPLFGVATKWLANALSNKDEERIQEAANCPPNVTAIPSADKYTEQPEQKHTKLQWNGLGSSYQGETVPLSPSSSASLSNNGEADIILPMQEIVQQEDASTRSSLSTFESPTVMNRFPAEDLPSEAIYGSEVKKMTDLDGAVEETSDSSNFDCESNASQAASQGSDHTLPSLRSTVLNTEGMTRESANHGPESLSIALASENFEAVWAKSSSEPMTFQTCDDLNDDSQGFVCDNENIWYPMSAFFPISKAVILEGESEDVETGIYRPREDLKISQPAARVSTPAYIAPEESRQDPDSTCRRDNGRRASF